LKSETPRGSGDDTALNGIELECRIQQSSPYYDAWSWRRSSEGGWGSWLAYAQRCGKGNAIRGVRMKVESSQGGGDDTGANRLEYSCADGSIRSPDAYTSWGTWSEWKYCPSGSAICGIRTRVEGSRGSSDDTALNGAEFACCSL
jgi:hypothetical protein